MLPSQLQASSFASYPPEARKLASGQLPLLRRMPLAFVPLLLREVIAFDWKFPAERAELLDQFSYLRALSEAKFSQEMQPFASIRLTPAIEAVDWVREPAAFSEQLSAHLWATHQIESFREASVAYVSKLNASRTERKNQAPRFTAVIMGQGARGSQYPLFRKLRRAGTYFTSVDGRGGRAALLHHLHARAAKHEQPYGHWYVNGGAGVEDLNAGLGPGAIAQLSYANLQTARNLLIAKMRQVMAPGGAGPEALRSMMARMNPQDLGLPGDGPEGLLNRFQISVLTEGSGTQLFSTTFVQWSAREILRRAQPLTLICAYSPRQREQSMQEMLSGKQHAVKFDAEGSLIDADMGAYYTWINGNRLPESQAANFLAWFEEGSTAVALGPSFAKGSESHEATTLGHLLEKMTASL